MIDQITGETYLYEEVSPQGYLFKWRGDYVMFHKLQIGDNLYNLQHGLVMKEIVHLTIKVDWEIQQSY